MGGVDGGSLTVEEAGRCATVRLHGREVGVACSLRVRHFPTHEPNGVGSAQCRRDDKTIQVLHLDVETIVLGIRHRDRSRLNDQVGGGRSGRAIGGVERIRGAGCAAAGGGGATHLPDACVQAGAGNLAVEGDQGGGSATDKVPIDGIGPDHVGFAMQADGDAQEIDQAAVAAGGTANAHGADCAIVVRDFGNMGSGEAGRGVGCPVRNRIQALCHHHGPVRLYGAGAAGLAGTGTKRRSSVPDDINAAGVPRGNPREEAGLQSWRCGSDSYRRAPMGAVIGRNRHVDLAGTADVAGGIDWRL